MVERVWTNAATARCFAARSRGRGETAHGIERANLRAVVTRDRDNLATSGVFNRNDLGGETDSLLPVDWAMNPLPAATAGFSGAWCCQWRACLQMVFQSHLGLDSR